MTRLTNGRARFSWLARNSRMRSRRRLSPARVSLRQLAAGRAPADGRRRARLRSHFRVSPSSALSRRARTGISEVSHIKNRGSAILPARDVPLTASLLVTTTSPCAYGRRHCRKGAAAARAAPGSFIRLAGCRGRVATARIRDHEQHAAFVQASRWPRLGQSRLSVSSLMPSFPAPVEDGSDRSLAPLAPGRRTPASTPPRRRR